jgi:hypothetical protein
MGKKLRRRKKREVKAFHEFVEAATVHYADAK